jgi:ATP-dependent protease ClpP protease subunit
MIIATGIIGKDITINNITNYIIDRKLLISSPGGSLYEGWAIHDLLKGKVDEIQAVGVCASAAISVLLAAPIRSGTPNSRFLIHNPYIDTFGGDAQKMQQMATDLQIEQDVLVKRYSEITGIEEERFKNVMVKEVYLLPEEAINLKLITKINPEIMNIDEKIEKRFNVFEQILNRVKKAIIKNSVFEDVDGNELDFGDKVTEKEQIVIGVTATVNGTPAEGKYVMADGVTYVFEGGKLTEVIAPIEDKTKELEAENEKLKTENEAQKNEIENLKKAFNDFKNKAETELKNVSDEFIKFRKSFSNEKIEDQKLNPKISTKKTIKL